MMKGIKTLVIVMVMMVFGLMSNTLCAQSETCIKFSKANALKEIRNKTPKLVIIGGVVRAGKPGDAKFAKRYKLQFIDTGCVIEDTKCIEEYNKVTFDYLDKKYGKKWRKQVRQDLAGL